MKTSRSVSASSMIPSDHRYFLGAVGRLGGHAGIRLACIFELFLSLSLFLPQGHQQRLDDSHDQPASPQLSCISQAFVCVMFSKSHCLPHCIIPTDVKHCKKRAEVFAYLQKCDLSFLQQWPSGQWSASAILRSAQSTSQRANNSSPSSGRFSCSPNQASCQHTSQLNMSRKLNTLL